LKPELKAGALVVARAAAGAPLSSVLHSMRRKRHAIPSERVGRPFVL
jgi:hypothetical protein